jgi:selenocysteine-specific elongation factor
MSIPLILGTAGHIDHGKTSLVKALTGVDTDRLPEEQRRGITIDLGFAELDLGPYRLGIVDVPGHERFVRNMLAGATSVDLALLVVAADDSVKPQTREHLEILRLLDLPAGVIALTKCDLADPVWIDLVADEVRQLVRGTFLERAELVKVSALTGSGLDELRQALAQAAAQAAERRPQVADRPFRLAIDRVFTMPGFGTVVTGSVGAGRVRLEEELDLQPAGIRVRVRGLQNHDRPVEAVGRGERAAINAAGVHHDQIGRGQELATPGYLVPTRLVSARLRLLPAAPRALKSRARVRLHLGAAEVMASVVLLEGTSLEPGADALAQLHTSAPVVAVWGQPFVVRSESPVTTIGGGRILDPAATRIRPSDAEARDQLAALGADDPLERAAAAAYSFAARPWQPADLVRAAGVADPGALVDRLVQTGRLRSLKLSPQRRQALHELVYQRLAARIEGVLGKMHDEQPLETWLERARLTSRLAGLGEAALVEALLAELARENRIRNGERGVGLAGRGPQLSTGEMALLEQFVERYRAAGRQPPTIEEVRQSVSKNRAATLQLLALAAAQGRLAQVSADYYFHVDALREIQAALVARLEGRGLTVAEIRDLLASSRKYVVPLCEYFDRIGLTRRQGDLRVLAGSQKAVTLSPASRAPP